MRQNINTADRGTQPIPTASLFVKLDTVTDAWRLVRWVIGTDPAVNAECSARLFPTCEDARAYGQRAYGETALNWPRYV